MCDDQYFYVLANKREDVVGYYLFMVEIADPSKPAEYLINWPNKTAIASVDLDFLWDNYDDDFTDDQEGDQCASKKHLCVSYKAEGLNTYNLFVFDIETKIIRFWHESF